MVKTATAPKTEPKSIIPPKDKKEAEAENLPATQQNRSLGGVNERNAFEAYGDQVSSRNIVGTLIKFTKGDWVKGEDMEDVEVGTKFVANMDHLLVGWIKWWENKPVEQIMGPVAEGFQPPRRNTLGDEDEDEWEVDETSGKPRDPWQFSNYLIMKNVDDDELFTFATSSRGGLGAVGEMCKHYGKEMRSRPDDYPIIEIGTSSYQHQNKQYGRIYVPILKVVDWQAKSEFNMDGVEEEVEEVKPAPKKAAAGGKKR